MHGVRKRRLPRTGEFGAQRTPLSRSGPTRSRHGPAWWIEAWGFADEDLRRQLIDKLNQIPSVQIDRDNVAGRPSIAYSALLAPESRETFFATFEWAADLIRRG
jgi:hypothetical protein